MAQEDNMISYRILKIRSMAIFVGFLATTPAHAQTPSICADTASQRSQIYRDNYRLLVSGTDTATVNFRARSGLPTLSPTQVRLVGDTAVCRTASIAYDATVSSPDPLEPMIVLELGSKRIVAKNSGRRGPWLNLLFNQDFTSLLYKIGF